MLDSGRDSQIREGGEPGQLRGPQSQGFNTPPLGRKRRRPQTSGSQEESPRCES